MNVAMTVAPKLMPHRPRAEETRLRWLQAFHEGRGPALESCYRDHFATVEHAVGRLLAGADRETVIQDVFLKLVGSADVRRTFKGGDFAAWVATIARHQAIDFLRKHGRDQAREAQPSVLGHDGITPSFEERVAAARFVERFRREHLPPAWGPVFDARFLQHLSQREAARALSMHRTTLAYRELQIRRLLRRAVLGAAADEQTPAPMPSDDDK